MARPLRVNVEDGWYHITARGTERRPIFTEDRERRHLLELLGAMSERFGVLVHSYVLLNNHFHVLLQTPRANASAAMQWLKTSYSMWFNRRHERVGPLFQGRFKGVLVDGEGSWALQASVYLHLNPVRVAGLGLDKRGRRAEGRGYGVADRATLARRVAVLRGYGWSSYRAYAGHESAPEWLTCDVLLARAGGAAAYRRYAMRWVTQGRPPEAFTDLREQWAIGSSAFVQKVKRLVRHLSTEQPQRRQARVVLATLERIVTAVEREKREPWAAFRDRHGDWGRDLVLCLARRRSGLTLREIAERLGGLEYKAVASAVARFERRLPQERLPAAALARCLAQLKNNET